jgi:Family of unknown function (DUF5683)
MKPLFCFIFLLFTCQNLTFGQADSIKIKNDTLHSVRKATIFSAVLPGSGQIYNHLAQPKGKKKAFWKVPIIYAGLGISGYSIIYNHSEVLNLRREYRSREANPSLISAYPQYDQNGLLILEKQNASFRDYSILAFIFVYALQVTDAAVEAHFVHFDISKDLTLNLKPWTHQNTYTGLSLSFNFR